MLFYIAFVVSAFMAACLLLGLVLLISNLIDRNGKPVDGGYGAIVGRHWETYGHGNDQESTLVYEAECTIDGIYYRQDAKRSSKKILVTKTELAENNNIEVEIRYYRKKNNKVSLRIYEPAITLKKAFLFLAIGIVGVLGLVLSISIKFF